MQIDNMKKYFSNEFFDSLTNLFATSKNYHKIKFKKPNYDNVNSRLSGYINDRSSLCINPTSKILNKTSSVNIVKNENKININENLKRNETKNSNKEEKNSALQEKNKKDSLSESMQIKRNNCFSDKKNSGEKAKSSNINSNNKAKEKEILKKSGIKIPQNNSVNIMECPLFEYYQTEVLLDLKSIRKQKMENSSNNDKENSIKDNNINNNNELIICNDNDTDNKKDL